MMTSHPDKMRRDWLLLLLLAASFPSPSTCHCPLGCLCNDETLVVLCQDAGLDVIPHTLNPSIQSLVLSGNRIETVENAALQFHGDLTHLDLSHNRLVTIVPKSFKAQEKLIELHLDFNKVSSLTNRTFVGLKSLSVLSIRSNYLQNLSAGLFAFLPRLEELDLGQNRITEIHPLSFSGLTTLRVLYIDGNSLEILPTRAFEQLSGLAELHAGGNLFTVLQSDWFAPLRSLVVLDLSNGQLNNISLTAFEGVKQLKTLRLNDNDLYQIPTKQLGSLDRLEELVVGQNQFLEVGPRMLEGLHKLKKIDISGSPRLRVVRKGAFEENLALETVVLNNNKMLDMIEEGTFSGLNNLKRLSLRGSAFVTFSETLVSWTTLDSFDLSENPLQCTCDVRWLRDQLSRRNASGVLCHGPAHLRRLPLASLSTADLNCSFVDPHQRTIIAVVCAATLGVLALVAFLLYRFRKRICKSLEDCRWGRDSLSRKGREYQKTFTEEEFFRVAQQNSLKPIPVTEL